MYILPICCTTHFIHHHICKLTSASVLAIAFHNENVWALTYLPRSPRAQSFCPIVLLAWWTQTHTHTIAQSWERRQTDTHTHGQKAPILWPRPLTWEVTMCWASYFCITKCQVLLQMMLGGGVLVLQNRKFSLKMKNMYKSKKALSTGGNLLNHAWVFKNSQLKIVMSPVPGLFTMYCLQEKANSYTLC